MGKQVSSLSVMLSGSVAPLVGSFKTAEHAFQSFIGKIGHVGTKILEMTGIAGAAAGVIGGAFEISKGFQLAAQFETANVQLTALTGSASVAKQLLGELKDFAKSSPFEFPELEQATKKLLAVGVGAGQITPLLKEVGEVAAGTGTDIGSISDMFARVAAEGKLSSRELKEFGRQGIPVVQTLAAQFHTTAAGVSQLAENGQIGFTQLQQAFEAMTQKGGRFNGILEAQSHTLGGVWKNLSSTLDDQLANVGEAIAKAFDVTGLLPKITTLIDKLGSVAEGVVTISAPYIAKFVDIVSNGLDWVMRNIQPFAQDIVGAMAIAGFAFTHAGDIVDLIGYKIAAGMEKIVGNVKYAATNIGTILSNLPELLSGSVSLDDLIKPREIGDLEKRLTEAGDKVGSSLGDGMNQALLDAMKSVDGFFTKVATPPPVTIPVSVDPIKQAITIEPHLGKLIYAGSAEAQALRIPTRVASAAGGAAMQFTPSSPVNLPGTNQQQQQYTPALPSLPGAGAVSAAVTSAKDDAIVTELKALNQWGFRIELNTRGQTGTGAAIAQF